MVTNIMGALGAYKQSGGLADVVGDASSQAAGGQSFGDVLKTFASDAVSSMQAGEKAAATSAIGGSKADLPSIVTAIDNAEVLLDEITTIRDKAITAYQTITGEAI